MLNICELIKEKKIKLCTKQLESLKIRTASTQLVSERERERGREERQLSITHTCAEQDYNSPKIIQG